MSATRTRPYHRGLTALAFLAPLALLPAAAKAQDGFAAGSFESPAQSEETPAGTQTTPQSGFGGSFADATGEDAAPSDDSAGDDGFGGSFASTGDDSTAAAGTASEGDGFGGSFESTATATATDETATEAENATTEAASTEATHGDGHAHAEQTEEADHAEHAEEAEHADHAEEAANAEHGEETAHAEEAETAEHHEHGESAAHGDHAEEEAVVAHVDVAPQLSGLVAPHIYAFEMRDYGVPPRSHLRAGEFHAATPIAIPGGTVISTDALVVGLLTEPRPHVVIDVLGADYAIPGAVVAPELASAGTFHDRTQQRASIWLSQVTGGNYDMPIVIYCSDPMCWLSYNAALRTVAAGYRNVFWYRGGLQAWQMAGLAVYPSGF